MPKKRHWYFDAVRYQVRTSTESEFPDGHQIPKHSHPWHQLVYAVRGVMTVRTPDGSWVVPPHRAVWVPAHTQHSILISGAVSMRTLYFAPRLGASMPNRCRVLAVSPLLRELILHLVELNSVSFRVRVNARLVGVLLDHLRLMETKPFHLPMPRDRRARRVAESLQNEPSTALALAELARSAGASKRTLERLFKRETGLGFGKWRQQLRLGHALRLLASGEPVTNVAQEIGYLSPSAFIAAFRMTFGETPAQYFRAA